MKSIFISTLLLLSINLFAVDKYWTGALNNNWNANGNWSLSSGGPANTTFPVAADIAFFDGNGNVNCNINSNSNVDGFNMLSGYTSTITQNASITIGGNDFNQADGIFIGGNQDIDINGYFFLSGGTFTSTTSTMFIGTTINTNATIFNHSAGTFNHNNGLIEFNATSSNYATRTYTVDVIPSTIFNDIEIDLNDNGAGEERLASATGDVITCIGNVIHDDGAINANISLLGNLIVNSEANGGVGWIAFNGNASQSYTVTGGFPRTCGIEINKTANGVIPNATTDIRITRFNQIQGDFTCPTNLLKLETSWNASLTVFTHVSGNYFHNNGTFEFEITSPVYANRLYTIDIIPTTIFNNLVIDINDNGGGEDRLTTAVGDTLQCIGNITHDDGSVYGNFGLLGNLFINPESGGGIGWFIFNSTGAQTYTDLNGTSRTCGIAIDKTSGGVTPLNTTNLASTQFNQIQGDFTCPTGLLRFGGVWNNSFTIFRHTAGTFSHNNGTIELDPSCTNYATRTYTVNVNSTTLFNNMVIDANSSSAGDESIAPATGDTVKIASNLLLEDGATRNNYISCEGNVTILPDFTSGNSALIFSGNGNQSFDLTGATSNHNEDLIIDKPNGYVNLLSNLEMDAGSGYDLYLQDGFLNSTTSNMLIMGDNVRSYSASNNSFVNGVMRKIGNDAFTFPIGKNDTAFAPISISAPANNSDHFTAEYFQINPDNVLPTPYLRTSKEVVLEQISGCEYWILDRTNGNANVNVTLSWDVRSCGVTSLPDLAVARWDGAMWRNHGNGGTTGNTANGTVVSAGNVTSFSPFTLASLNELENPLPIELLSFTADLNNSSVDLKWQTVSEINNDYFTLEKSSDGLTWQAFEEQPGAGNSSTILNYLAIDLSPFKGVSYYRLKQTDFNGSYQYSNIESVNFITNEVSVYPNPFKDELHLTNFDNNNYYKVYSADGRLVFGGNTAKINTAKWSKGFYTLILLDASGAFIQKHKVVK